MSILRLLAVICVMDDQSVAMVHLESTGLSVCRLIRALLL